MARAKKQKSWSKMSARELAAATSQFDKPIKFEDTKPLSPAARQRWERAQRRQLDNLRLDPKLLSAASAYAKEKHIPLAQVLERGLRRELAVKD